VFGATDQKAGALVTHMDFLSLPFLNHRFEVRGGVLEKSCSKLLSSFLGSCVRVRKGPSRRAFGVKKAGCQTQLVK